MMQFGRPQPATQDDVWKARLDRFARENARELAALAWAFYRDRGDSEEMLGIDLQPAPHFISFTREAIDRFNRNVNGQLREVLGILDGHNPEVEVLYIAIGHGQLKLINFAPESSPTACFEEIGLDLSTLLETLEARLAEEFAD